MLAVTEIRSRFGYGVRASHFMRCTPFRRWGGLVSPMVFHRGAEVGSPASRIALPRPIITYTSISQYPHSSTGIYICATSAVAR